MSSLFSQFGLLQLITEVEKEFNLDIVNVMLEHLEEVSWVSVRGERVI